jgi:hypothetical protein
MPEDASRYNYPFLNQYVRIPKHVSDRVKAEHPTEHDNIRHCIGLIIVNLLANTEVAYSRDKNFYTENRTENFTWTNMLKAVDIAEESSYAIKLKKGYRDKDFERGLASTLGPGLSLKTFGPPVEMELETESLPLLTIDGKPIYDKEGLAVVVNRLRADSSEVRALERRLNSIYDESLRLNREYWNKMKIGRSNLRSWEFCLKSVGLTRVFKEGGVGRWFQKGELSYQELSEEARSKLLLNGEEVVELDYPAMHPHIMYAWEGKQCPDDVYERVMALSGCSRFIAKSVVLIAINARSYRSFIGAINLERGKLAKARVMSQPILYDELKKYRLHPKDIIQSVKKAHPVLEKYIYSGEANRLMLEESDIMTSVLLRLMELGISALPVHDSVIVPIQKRELVKNIMEEAYSQYTGFGITVG